MVIKREAQLSPSERQFRYFDLAKTLALMASGRAKHGSVIVKSGRIMGHGYNQPLVKHKWQQKGYRTLHAEIAALDGLDDWSENRFVGGDMYNYRSTSRGFKANSRPCLTCLQSLSDLGISRVFYTTDAWIYPGYGVIKL